MCGSRKYPYHPMEGRGICCMTPCNFPSGFSKIGPQNLSLPPLRDFQNFHSPSFFTIIFLFSGYYVKLSSHVTLVNQVGHVQDPCALNQWQPFKNCILLTRNIMCKTYIMALTVLFKNMRTLKFKSQLTFAYFAAVNHLIKTVLDEQRNHCFNEQDTFPCTCKYWLYMYMGNVVDFVFLVYR